MAEPRTEWAPSDQDASFAETEWIELNRWVELAATDLRAPSEAAAGSSDYCLSEESDSRCCSIQIRTSDSANVRCLPDR